MIALTLSPMMCSVFLKSAEEGRFAKLVNRVFGAITRWYGRQLDRSLDYRPITALFALTILGLSASSICTHQRSSRPRRIEASCSR